MKFYAIAVGYNKEKKEHVYNKITTDWEEARFLVQGVSKKKDNVETVYKSCNSLKEANEYLDEILKEALEKQNYETPALEEVIAKRILPDTDSTKKEKVTKKEQEIKETKEVISLSVEDVELFIENDSKVFDEVLKNTEKVNIDKKNEVKKNDIEEQNVENVVKEEKIVINKKEEVIIKEKKKKDSIDLYQAYTFRSYDEKTNYLAYGYTLVKNGVTLKTESFIEKSKEPTFEGSRILGTMLAIEKAIDMFKRLIPSGENVIIMIHHLENKLEEDMLLEIPMDNGEYFFDWLKLLKDQYPHIRCDFTQIDLVFPEKVYIKLQVSVKKKIIN